MRSDDPVRARKQRPAAAKPPAKAASRKPRRRSPAPPPQRNPSLRTIGAILLTLLLGIALARAALPLWSAAFYLAAGLLSLHLYRKDKLAAQAGDWRVSEGALHAVDLCGGIIGGLLGQQRFRHKTRKASFVFATAGIAVLHGLGLAAMALRLIAPGGVARLLP